MKILFIHQNFPGQYKHLVRHLSALPGNEVVFLTQRPNAEMSGVKKIVYKARRTITPGIHRYLSTTEAGVLNGQEVVRVAAELKRRGFTPDVMLGHNGWGEIWYLKDVFPQTPLLGYFEFFYQAVGADVAFDPVYSSPSNLDDGPRTRTKNIGNLIGLDAVDLGQCPTKWQRSVYPARCHSRLRVVHDGVDTCMVVPAPQARLPLPNGRELSAGDEVLTYVARNLEPYRGFPSFMRSLPEILTRRPKAQVVIIGADDVSYGARPPAGTCFREMLLKELGDSLDLSRVHFLGQVPYSIFLRVLQISRAHIYLTYPFVLSWSMLEAMSAECLVIGSRTPPVQEVIRHGENGLLVDFFNTREIAETAVNALAEPAAFAAIRRNARRTVVKRYDLQTVCLPAQLGLLHELGALRQKPGRVRTEKAAPQPVAASVQPELVEG
jgi:glycosyltransferase involved in cell wall biosynthesis